MTGRIVWSLVLVACLCGPGTTLAEGEASGDSAPADSARASAEKQRELEERIEELEATQAAQEAATRRIIRDALDKTGSNVNAYVALGGTFELLAGWVEDFRGGYEGVMGLNTVEFDFEISVDPWTLGNIVLEYVDGGDHTFLTVEGDEQNVDRVNIDTAVFTFGDTYRIPPFLTVGRMIVPFGISTGDPVADVLTLEDPLTIEAFEQKEDAVMFGLEFPTPSREPLPPRREPPPIRPKVLHPLFRGLSRALGYRPPPHPTPPPAMVTPTRDPPAFRAAVTFFHGETFARKDPSGWRPQAHIGGTVSYRNRWMQADVDYTSSIFDSSFLGAEYRPFLRQIGLVPGMAGTVRLSLGPFPLIAEWNGAIEDTKFTDGAGRTRVLRPQAWQVSAGFQFGWNRFSRVQGAEGTYLAVGYSESEDLAGVTRVVDDEEIRVGAVPQRRYLAHAAEWMWPGVRFAVEYSRIEDYDTRRGGTGRTADAIRTQITYEW